jgi:tetratricopeptide (TPR) repeat protein
MIFPIISGLLLLICTWIFPYSGYRLRLPSTPLAAGCAAAVCAAGLFVLYQFFPAYWYLLESNIFEIFGREDKATAALETCGKLPVPALRCEMKLGTLYMKNQRTGEALAVFRKIEKKYPNYPEVHKSIGDLYFFNKNFWEVIEQYRAYREVKPQDKEAMEKLAATLIVVGNNKYEKRKFKDALRFLKEAILLDEKYRADLPINMRLAELHAMRGEWKESAVHYKIAADLQPEVFDIQIKTAETCEKAKDYENAIIYYKRSIQLHPDAAQSYVAIGDVYCDRLHDTEKAKEWYRKTIIANAVNPAADAARQKLKNLR